jgi:hypothetical protein
MKSLAIGLLLAGLATGPGYYIYCYLFSGSLLVESIAYSSDTEKYSMGPLQMSSSSNEKWHVPLELSLSPEMNPISISANIKYIKPINNTKRYFLNYIATLSHNKKTLWKESFSIKPKKRKKDDTSVSIIGIALPSTNRVIKTFSVSETGKYLLNLRKDADSKTLVSTIEISVRNNIQLPNMNIIGAGIAMLIASFTLLIMFGKRRKS